MIEKNDSDRLNFRKNPHKVSKFPSVLTSQNNSVAIYTVLCILDRMKKQLGIEAMLEYMDEYLATINKYNPKIQHAVDHALIMIDLAKMYWEAVGGRRSDG